jgi:hypothetical protein
MKKMVAFAILILTSICADYHEPSVTLNFDERYPFSNSDIHFTLHHQSTVELEDDNIIILHALSAPYSPKSFHHEVGVGYRKIGDNFTFGTNFVYANQNSWGFFNHHLVPGIELFYDPFSLVYNRYLPVKDGVRVKNTKYLFHDVSEVCLSYRPRQKYEFSLTSNFNHNTKKFGYAVEISAYISENFKLSVVPYCEPTIQSGIAFSLGYHFGGPKKNVNQPLKKSHRFFFTSDLKEVKKFESPKAPFFVPSSNPVILKTITDEGVPQKIGKESPWWRLFER